MKILRAVDAPVLLFTVVLFVVGCVTPQAPAPQAPAPQDDAHIYCGCLASCGGPAQAIPDMPLNACMNPPPGCASLPFFCENRNGSVKPYIGPPLPEQGAHSSADTEQVYEH